MRKILIYIWLLSGLSLLSCNSKTEEYDSTVEMIPVILNKTISTPIEKIIDKIEIIPLETDTNCLLSVCNKMTYYKELELFAFFDKDHVIFLFSKEGKFISNSETARGPGPAQYWIVVDFLYNPYSKCIEILNPYGTIYRYDLSFNFIEKISLEQTEIVFHEFLPLSETQYILTHSIISSSDAVLYFCDYNKGIIEETVNYEKYYLSTFTMNIQLFFQFNDQFLFSPKGLDYHFYQINTDSSTITPVMKLDFGGDEITKKQIERMSGYSYKALNKEKDLRLKHEKMMEMGKVLVESNFHTPILKLINDKYAYIHIFTNHKRSNYIYNRKTKKGFYQTIDSPFKIYPIFGMDENVLMAMIQPFEIEEYIDKRYMSQLDIEKMKYIQEDDNPIIVKYYLK